jgi:hypothetical protein
MNSKLYWKVASSTSGDANSPDYQMMLKRAHEAHLSSSVRRQSGEQK